MSAYFRFRYKELRAALYLASDAPSYTTGAIAIGLAVDQSRRS